MEFGAAHDQLALRLSFAVEKALPEIAADHRLDSDVFVHYGRVTFRL